MKKRNKIVIFDTNSLVSAALIAGSVNDRALNKLFLNGFLAFSEETFSEFVEVLFRSKFDKYLGDERRFQIIDRIERNGKLFIPKENIRACRDPKDDMFLELAIAAAAECIVTGDKALSELHPFRGIPILSAAEFIELF